MTCRSGRDSKGVLEKDMLFATLDTHQRSIEPEKGKKFILTDTVGFVSGLPHSLIEAFKSTLEEVAYADLILHVVDASYDDHDFHMRITDRVLEEIGAGGREKITVYNRSTCLIPISFRRRGKIPWKYPPKAGKIWISSLK